MQSEKWLVQSEGCKEAPPGPPTPAGRVRRFEDLIAWQKARRVTAEVYRLTRETPLGRDFGLRDQMCRAAVSVMSNVAEGFERPSRKEFRHFLAIAKASAGELRSQAYVALDAQYLSREQFRRLLGDTTEVARVISGLRTSIRPD